MSAVRHDELARLVGRELGPSGWLEITQERVNAFAAATEDHQWLHTDPVRAAAGPFRTPVAHGFLTLSLVVHFWNEAVQVENPDFTVNYGLDRVRFPTPVPVGSRIRGRFRIEDVHEIDGGVQARIEATVEREGHEKPACVAIVLLRFLGGSRGS